MASTQFSMRLLGGFEMRRNQHKVALSLTVHRLLGFLALIDRHVPRGYVAETLWPETNEERAHANLRTALWRLHPLDRDVLEVTQTDLSLEPSVDVDTRTIHEAARAYRRSGVLPDPESLLELRGELLPGCWDSWLVFERELLRQETVELLEATSRSCRLQGERHLALLLALRAVECDSLRESSNLLAIEMRRDVGDPVGAVRHARSYARQLETELGIPSPEVLHELVAPVAL
jgi:DNA-binding SARP family transcriptional activator